jgi:hypothetical protein
MWFTKNKPLTSLSQPNLALNARNTSIFFFKEEHLKTLKPAAAPLFRPRSIQYIHAILSGDLVPLRFGDFWKSSIQYACVLLADS